jgi:sulfur relay (sulfurtransferase) complex TusBCD TusD component (DsrE family)
MRARKFLLILTRRPCDDTAGMRNALSLMTQEQKAGAKVRVFLMNHAVFLAYEQLKSKEEYQLQKSLLEAISKGGEVKVCKAFITRCGTGYIRLRREIEVASMSKLLEWTEDSERVLVF